MTYNEWFKAMGARFNMTDSDISLVLCNQHARIPNPNDTVDVAVAKRALCDEFTTIIPLMNVSEGGFSISWNMEAIKLWHKETCKQLGIQDAFKPKVKSVPIW